MGDLMTTVKDVVSIVSGIVVAIGVIFGIYWNVSNPGRSQQRETIMQGNAVPEKKTDDLYRLSKLQSQIQFWSNLAWGIVGIAGGYLAGHFLLH